MDGYSEAFPQLGSVYRKPHPHVKQSSPHVAKLDSNSSQEGKTAGKSWGPKNSAASPWGHPNLMQKVGMHNNGNATRTTQNTGFQNPAIPNGISLRDDSVKSGMCSVQSTGRVESHAKDEIASDVDDDDDYHEIVFDTDDDDGDDIFDDDSDTETSESSHEKRKKCKWFRAFFDVLDKLSVEKINTSSREWHCPACKDGPGAIDWYRGLDPLIYHARTKKTRRAKLHRIFAETLNEEAIRRGILLTPLTEAFGRWEGLDKKVKDHEIVWPPMVVIMNTRYDQEDNGKWLGMGNQELLDYFGSYAALKARHSYGPQGHRGMSVLIFEQSAAGYLEAARLNKHFKEQGRDREAWDCNRVPFCPGGKRQLYGYMALKEDLEIFNLHSQGKSKLKYEMVSYQERVESQIKQINEDSQELVKVKNKYLKEHRQTRALAVSVRRLGEKLRQTMEENQIVRRRTELLREQNKEEMDFQEIFFKDQITIIHQAINAKEESFEKQQQAKRDKAMQSNANPVVTEDAHRLESIARFVKLQDKEMQEFEAQREKLIKDNEEKKAAVMKRCWEEQLELEKELESELTELMEQYSIDCPEIRTRPSDQF